MKELYEKLLAQEVLTQDQAKELMLAITNEEVPAAQVASILTVYRLRFPVAAEIVGFREALLEQAMDLKLDCDDLIDVCGTGGDGKDTFNISTLTALVLAACGVKVSKHGNYSFSSSCGSSNVLESMGLVFTNDIGKLNASLEQAGICFLHAPLFHPALKGVGPIRKELAVRTVFNLLGPLVNPARPRYQFAGVANIETLRLYQEVLSMLKQDFAVLHSYDGYDEISLTDRFAVYTSSGAKEYFPEELNLERLKQEDLSGGGSIESASEIFKNVLEGKGTDAQVAAVSTNAAFALMLTSSSSNFEEAYNQAKEALSSGKAKEVLSKAIEAINA